MSIHDKKLYGTATVGTKGQVVIPAEARKELGISEGDRLYVVGSHQAKWIGFIKEEQFHELLTHISEGVDSLKSSIQNKE